MTSKAANFAKGLRNSFVRRKAPSDSTGIGLSKGSGNHPSVSSPSSASPLLAPLSPSILVSHLHQRARLYITRHSFILTSLLANPNADISSGQDLFREEILEMSFEDATFRRLDHFELLEDARAYDVYGIAGVLELHGGPRLILITQRTRCGKVRGKDIFSVGNVAVLPLEEERSIQIMDSQFPHAASSFSPSAATTTSSPRSRSMDSTDGIHDHLNPSPMERKPSSSPSLKTNGETCSQGFDEESAQTIHHQDTKGWSDGEEEREEREEEKKANREEGNSEEGEGIKGLPHDQPSTPREGLVQGVKSVLFGQLRRSTSGKVTEVEEVPDPIVPSSMRDSILTLDEENLEGRAIREICSILKSGGFYFSYDLDLTTPLQKQHFTDSDSQEEPASPTAFFPLWKRVDRRFWWNEHMLQPLIDQELNCWILPLMQGFVQVEQCSLHGQTFDFVLISRRSRERAGLRYERRGVNERGEVANFVETEQALFLHRDDSDHLVSFLQTRGSIPLFWGQSPYRLRPVPWMERSDESNRMAIERHFLHQLTAYGRQHCLSLVEQEGREAICGQAYRRHLEALDNPDVNLIQFDFHAECKGMKYENLSRLITRLEPTLSQIGYFWSTGPDSTLCEQKGVYRTNCMDCLDRTNVVQSAIARHILNLQLMRLGVQEHPEEGIATDEEFEMIFNHVWADNGDHISREYAGTSALKGDFTRTGKRNFQGMVNDASNSLARLYQNAFRDHFRQAVIDYLLGNHPLEILQHVRETSKAIEPGDEDRWVKVRRNAVEISSSIVLGEGENLVSGWTLLSPPHPNTLRGGNFEERVVLLSGKALYFCTFHYSLEKVVQFSRVALEMVESVQKGAYIVSTGKAEEMEEEDNYGLLIRYRTEGEATRYNSGSVRNARWGGRLLAVASSRFPPPAPPTGSKELPSDSTSLSGGTSGSLGPGTDGSISPPTLAPPSTTMFQAFKTLPPDWAGEVGMGRRRGMTTISGGGSSSFTNGSATTSPASISSPTPEHRDGDQMPKEEGKEEEEEEEKREGMEGEEEGKIKENSRVTCKEMTETIVQLILSTALSAKSSLKEGEEKEEEDGDEEIRVVEEAIISRESAQAYASSGIIGLVGQRLRKAVTTVGASGLVGGTMSGSGPSGTRVIATPPETLPTSPDLSHLTELNGGSEGPVEGKGIMDQDGSKDDSLASSPPKQASKLTVMETTLPQKGVLFSSTMSVELDGKTSTEPSIPTAPSTPPS